MDFLRHDLPTKCPHLVSKSGLRFALAQGIALLGYVREVEMYKIVAML